VKKEDKLNKFCRHNPILSSDENTMLGKVRDMKLQFVLDTGVNMTLVPEEIVPLECEKPGTTCLLDTNGGRQEGKTAEVDLQVGNWKRIVVVALAPSDTLHDGALLVKLLQDFGEGKYDRTVINAVKTSEKKAAELEEAKGEEESMREEQAGKREVQRNVSKGEDLSGSGVEKRKRTYLQLRGREEEINTR